MKRLLLILCCLAIGLGAWTILVRRGGKGAPEGAEDPRPVVLFHIVDAAGAGVAGASVADGHADEAGRFDFLIPEGKEAKVRVSSSGYCPAEVSVGPLEAGRKLDRWVRLERGRSLEARVCVAGSSQPAAGAHVKLDLHSGPVDSESPRFATADERGVVRFDGVPDFFFDLAVVPPYYKSGRYELELVPDRAPDPILIPARRSTHIFVEIIDDAGKPARRARVWTFDRGVWSGPTIAEDGQFETDVEDGRDCGIAAVDAAWALGILHVSGDGRAERKERVVLTPARASPDVQDLRVRVVDDETGRGISGAQITLARFLDWSGPGSDGLEPSLETDAEGWLAIGAFPFREVNVSASHEGYYGENVTFEADDPTALTGEIRLSRKTPSRTITCRAKQPVSIDWPWRENKSDGTIELSGFDSDDKTCDIRYRPKADLARDCVLKGVAVGSHDVALPLYPMGELLVRCTEPDGHAVPRVWVAVEGDGFSGNVRKEDPRGEMLVRDLPAGEGSVFVAAWGWGEIGPFPYVLAEGGRVEIAARFGSRQALLGTRLTLADGTLGSGFQVIVLDAAGESMDVVSERFWDPNQGGPTFETLSDGRCYLPLPEGDASVAFLGIVRWSRDASGGQWGGPLIGPEKVVVPKEGIIDLDLKLDWSVFVSGLDPPNVPTEFRRGDVIVSWDGREVHDIDDCTPREGPLRVTVRRGDETIDLNLPAGPHTAILDRQYFVVR